MNAHPSAFPRSPSAVRHVLVVDDQETIRLIFCSLLDSWGITPHTAGSLISACRMVVSEGPFDAVICNYELPDGNAFNLVDWMHEHQLIVPTVVPYGAVRSMREAPENVTLLHKPFDPLDLKEALEHARPSASPEELQSLTGG